MRRLLIALCLIAALPVHAEQRDPGSAFFSPKMGDFREELASVRQTGRFGVLMMFEQEECPFCERMRRTVLSQSGVQDWYRQHFLIFEIDIKGSTAMTDFQGRNTTEKAFALEHRARATPTFIFFDRDGEQAYRYTGTTQSAEEFLQLGRYVAEGASKTMPFNIYKLQTRVP